MRKLALDKACKLLLHVGTLQQELCFYTFCIRAWYLYQRNGTSTWYKLDEI